MKYLQHIMTKREENQTKIQNAQTYARTQLHVHTFFYTSDVTIEYHSPLARSTFVRLHSGRWGF
jgi:hypothetical protein